MPLIILLTIVTVFIAGSAEFFSVYGLAQTFSSAFIPVVIMGSALGAGKLLTASFLYRHWKILNWHLKGYLVFAVLGLMFLTSWGIFGYLSASYQSDSLNLKQNTQRIEYLSEQKTNYENRLTNIDTQIKDVPDKAVRSKIQLIKTLSDEKTEILAKLNQIETERGDLMNKQVSTEVKTGPIVFVAKALNRTVDQATTYLIFIIMSVFDPLAVALTVAINVAINQRKIEKKAVKEENIIESITPVIEKAPIVEQPPVVTSESDDTLRTINSRLDSIANELNSNSKRNGIINSMREEV
jgi:hypothetical protein